MKDQGMSSLLIILLILLTYTPVNVWKCQEKIDVSHFWDLKG